MAAATSIALLSKKREHLVVLEEGLCNLGVATRRGEARITDEKGPLPVLGNVGRSNMEELHVVLQLKRHGIVPDPMDTLDGSSVASDLRGEEVALAAEHNDLACQQPLSIFHADVPDLDLVKHSLQGPVGERVVRSQHFEAVTHVDDSDIAFIP